MKRGGNSIIALLSTLWMPLAILAAVCFMFVAETFWEGWKGAGNRYTSFTPAPLHFLGAVRYVTIGQAKRIERYKIICIVTAIVAILSYIPGAIAGRMEKTTAGK